MIRKYACCSGFRKNRTSRTLLSTILLYLLLNFLVSCVTRTAPYDTAPIEEITFQLIEQAISSGDAVAALQDLSTLTRNSSAPDFERIGGLYETAAAALLVNYRQAVDGEDYVAAYAIAESLSALERSGYSIDGSIPSSYETLEAFGEWFIARGEVLPGLAILLKAGMSSDDQRRLERIASTAAISGYDSIRRYVTAILEPTMTVDGSSSIVSDKAGMIEGTVTIWVNRGIRIERGVGYPDRVIGSGFYIDSGGYIITNYHVIASEVDPEYEGFSRLYIRPADDESVRIPARVVGWDRIFDLALLKVDVTPRYVFSPAVTDDLRPGDRIYAIGSPAGLNKTITSGIVSATGRRFLQMGDAMQVDVPINPGSSGGPLIDESGALIGVVFAGIEQFEGINFAIPSRWLLASIPRLYLGGEASYPWLGLAAVETREGVEVIYVLPGEPAHRAGIERGDVLVEIAGVASSDIESVQASLIERVPGTIVPVVWKRAASRMSGLIALSTRPSRPMDVAIGRDIPERLIPPLFGLFLSETSRSLLGTNYVISRVIPGGIADETGLAVFDPLRIESFTIDEKNRIAILQVVVNKPKAGFIERSVRVGAYLEIDSFL